MKFIVDSMLGKLARWLRILGYDTAYDAFAEDNDLLRQARAEARILLTRDGPLAERASDGRCILIGHDHLDDQIGQLVRTLGLNLDRDPFTRCLICNEPIIEIPRDSVRDRVPPYVFQTQRHYRECPLCKRIYWRGTHMDRMESRLRRIKTRVREHSEHPVEGEPMVATTARVVFVTAPSEDEAAAIGRTLVEERLVACANILPGIRSIYRWQDAVEDDPEVLMVMKTVEECADAVVARVVELHSYDVPEVIVLPVEHGNGPYLDWVEDSIRGPDSGS
jgi:uncharacterized protein with PIN domain/uncharacterized protein involved in tolerance to divalent cations